MLDYGFRTNCYPVLWDNYWRNYRIDAETAVQIALQHVPDRIAKIELEYDGGLLVYDIDVLTESGLYEIKINANTGQVLKIEREYD
ncbi:MAG: peptidase [Clostridiales bacterium]|nr:peptidase [Clostridiales bacterium]